MANEVNYGRIALIPRGDFVGDVQYDVGDVVSYEGSSYLAKAKPPLATLPTDTEYWQISAQGSGGGSADKITATDPQSLGFTNAQGFIDVASEKLVDLESNFLTANRNVYVDGANGNDTTGDGSQAKPWKTIQKAVDMCPIIENIISTNPNPAYTISIANGEYVENIIINNKFIRFVATSTDGNIVINGNVFIYKNSNITIECPLTVNIANSNYHGFLLRSESYCYMGKPLTIVGVGVSANRCGICVAQSSCLFLNSYANVKDVHIGVTSSQCSNVYVEYANLKNCTYGYYSEVSSKLTIGNVLNSVFTNVTTKYIELSGGRIEFGSQGYQLIGSVTGKKGIAIDSELYTEFFVEFNANALGVLKGFHTIVVPSATLDILFKFYVIAVSNFELELRINKNSCGLIRANLSGTNVTDRITMTVYGKR